MQQMKNPTRLLYNPCFPAGNTFTGGCLPIASTGGGGDYPVVAVMDSLLAVGSWDLKGQCVSETNRD